MKQYLKIAYSVLTELGIDPIRIVFFCLNFPKYCFQYIKFTILSKKLILPAPILSDAAMAGGSTSSVYFLQDFFVAKLLLSDDFSGDLCDVGSRWDGFVGAVSLFRQVIVLDVRPVQVPDFIDVEMYITDMSASPNKAAEHSGYLGEQSFGDFDVVTCLHSLEHFGLGRYGDMMDPDGHKKGIHALLDLTKQNGKIIVSFPPGNDRVLFNMERRLNPNFIKKYFEKNGARLASHYDLIDDEFVEKNNSNLDLRSRLVVQVYEKLTR